MIRPGEGPGNQHMANKQAEGFYAVEWGGQLTIIPATSAQHAEILAERRFGAFNGPYFARPATEEDMAWYKAMGGKV